MSENLPVELIAVEAQTSGPGVAELIAEIRLLRAEVRAIAEDARKSRATVARTIGKWDDDGMPGVRMPL